MIAEADSFDRWGRSSASAEERTRQDQAARGAGVVAEKVTRELEQQLGLAALARDRGLRIEVAQGRG